MSAGRLVLLKKGGTVLAGLQNISLSWADESIDITTGENAGKRLLLPEGAQQTLDISCEGLTKDYLLQNLALGSGDKMLTDITLTWPIKTALPSAAGTLSGNFRLVSYEEGAPYKDAMTFSAKFESSGAWTYTAET